MAGAREDGQAVLRCARLLRSPLVWSASSPLQARSKMHSDLQKSAKDSTLEHSLFAAFNTD